VLSHRHRLSECNASARAGSIQPIGNLDLAGSAALLEELGSVSPLLNLSEEGGEFLITPASLAYYS